MKDYYNGINSNELLRFFGLKQQEQKQVKIEMMKDMYIDLHKEGFRTEVIKEKLVKAFGLTNEAQIYRYIKMSELNLD